MDIVIVSQYLRNIENFDGNNSRFVYLAKMLEEQHEVEIITSDFLHASKVHAKNIGNLRKIKVTAIHEPGYPKNVCLRRFYSHEKLAKGIEKYLDSRKKPNVCYCASPSLDVAYAVAKYCEKNKIRFIVDIQDLWPEAFKMVFHVPVMSDLIFAPMKKKADKVYGIADEIVAVSDTYCERALQVNKKCTRSHVVFLGTSLETFDTNANTADVLIKKSEEDGLWLGYCGSLVASYDIPCVISALKILKDKGLEVPKFIVMGDGARKAEFEEESKNAGIDAVFTGRLQYDQMCAQLVQCDIVVNPIVKGSAASIINKHGDYASAGLPVLNTQESLEYRNLIENYNMGINCKNGDAEDLAEKLKLLIENKELRIKMGKNARRCAEEKFDRKNSYLELIKCVIE